MSGAVTGWLSEQTAWLRARAPGILVAALIAMAAQFVSEHYGAPAMLMALLMGMAAHSAFETDSPVAAGVQFSAQAILKLGVALLGARISFELVAALGWPVVLLVSTAIVATIGAGILIGRLAGQPLAFSVLTAGAVSICGASAAVAISAALPKSERSEQDLLFTIMTVTILSTVAMILYPVALGAMGFDDQVTGAVLGATIHDVAQVVGAGFSVSEEAGDTATLVKLIRVTFLAPVVIAISLAMRFAHAGEATTSPAPGWPLPPFVIGFLILAGLNSYGLIPAPVASVMVAVSRAALLLAIAAVGMKTSLGDLRKVGALAVALVIAETLFLAGIVLGGINLIALGNSGV